MKTINFLTVAIMLLFGAIGSLQAQCSVSFGYTNTGNSYNFTATASAGVLNPVYIWTIDDHNNNTTSTFTTTSATLNHNFTGGSPYGFHYACLTVYDSLTNCQASYCDSVYTNTTSCAGFAAGANHTVSGNTASFTSTITGGTAPYAYAWNFHGLGTSTVANPSFTYPGPGWYAADLTVTDALGCQANHHDSVYIAGNGTPCANTSAGYQYNVSGNSASFYSYSNGFFPPFVQYIWDFGNGNYSYTANPTAQLANGWHNVCLTITDSMCTETYCDSIYVNGNNTPCNTQVIFFDSITVGNSVTFHSLVSGFDPANTYYSWNFGNGTYGSGSSPTAQLANGLHYICLTVSDSFCTETYCDSIYVGGNSCAGFAVSGSHTVSGNTASFTSNVTGGTPAYAYYWNFHGLGTSSVASPSFTYPGSGWYAADLTVYDAMGCQATYHDSVYIAGAPCVQNAVTLNLLFDNYATETSWTVTDASGNIVANGGNYPSLFNGQNMPIDLCLPTGCYNFNIYDSYGDGICCYYGQGNYSLVDVATGASLASGGSFAYSETTNFCVGGATNPCGNFGNGSFTYSVGSNGAVTFAPVLTSNQYPLNFAWDFGNGNTSTASNPTFTFANGYHLVCLTADSANCTYTYCDTIMVTSNNGNQNGPCANLTTNINITQDSINPFSLWMQPVVNGAAAGAGFTFVWDFGDNTGAVSGSPSHVYNGFGSYVVCLMALDTVNNCVSTFCDTISVDSSGNFSRSLTKPGFTVNTLPPVINFFTSTTQVEANAMTINLFPNPANNVVNLAISTEEAINGTVSILDLTGKVAYTNNLNVGAGQEQVSLPIDQLPSGVYLVRITSETTQQTMKFIKK